MKIHIIILYRDLDNRKISVFVNFKLFHLDLFYSNTNNKVLPPKRRPNFRGESAEDKQLTASPKATPGVPEAKQKANPGSIQLKNRFSKDDQGSSSYWPVGDDLSYVEIPSDPYIPLPPSKSEEGPKKGTVLEFQANQTIK